MSNLSRDDLLISNCHRDTRGDKSQSSKDQAASFFRVQFLYAWIKNGGLASIFNWLKIQLFFTAIVY